MNKLQIIAFYLPQYHPFKENDEWWGKGFTEWTNVGKAKPLFKGHNQPRVPTELGYYDLRLPSVREQQAQMAKDAGVTAFCYWHYWFGNGKRLIPEVFQEVLESGNPDFPFCLGWANHSWFAKNWNSDGTTTQKLLMEQTYPGIEDEKMHFEFLLKAFKDSRYVKVDGKPLLYIFAPRDLPTEYIRNFRRWAKDAEFPDLYLVANVQDLRLSKQEILSLGYDAVSYQRLGIKEIARQIRYQLDNLVIRSKLFSITATIGISQYPKDGNDFKSLYQACDKALYRGKDKGRDCHIIYDKNIHFGDIDEHHLSNDNLVVNRLSLSNFIGILVKNLLDPNMNINNIFEMIANYFNLDRILVLKSSDIISIYSKDKKNLKFEKFNIEEYKKYFVVDDILCINDTKTWRIKDETMYNTYKKYKTAALIQSLMKNSEGDIIGLLSFEMTTMKRVWQRSEINAMAIVSKILNVFLIK